MSNSYKVQQKCWMYPLKMMVLFAWSWSTNIIYSEVNNKIFSVQSCWFLLYILEMPVTESPTAVAVQDYPQLDDPELNHYIFMVIMLTKLYNYTWFNFIFGILLFYVAFILDIFLVNIVVVLLLEKVILTHFYLQKWYTWWWNNCEMKELGTI